MSDPTKPKAGPRKFTVDRVALKSELKRAMVQTERRNKARRIDWPTFSKKRFTV